MKNEAYMRAATLALEAMIVLFLGIGVNSIQDLNVKIAGILENISIHTKVLDDHETRIREVEHEQLVEARRQDGRKARD